MTHRSMVLALEKAFKRASRNVYVLKLADGTYGKVEVLSAAGGVVHVLCYHQPDGTTDIATETAE